MRTGSIWLVKLAHAGHWKSSQTSSVTGAVDGPSVRPSRGIPSGSGEPGAAMATFAAPLPAGAGVPVDAGPGGLPRPVVQDGDDDQGDDDGADRDQDGR